ncbi:3-hydroxyacyl-CoA dehydrogenase NAD-binding domain-containing protein [Jannaschia seohaensis]|uniref:3-hydroxyacyl-CoA dehydrogenase n=1 Tax=Jannaschia seohaensis TaxID=475081 RepID=A0A2Y9C1Q9_9RHOB|nr:3-hydroxyacyl-CoA dehydrogenase NAD-binding domain-containing protein [Jannaschia seohaensis]PWJ17045.1 3-hydroxyacyl-CoA dehydrogenase [Jannaschia seohaensis]SSA48382.1 3-hydroxyacyl-CoA dehydrogenase [Jannaschia seohaensis]
MTTTEAPTVTILGAGPIGLSFAAIFLDTGRNVTLIEPDPTRRAEVEAGIARYREAMDLAGLRVGRAAALDLRPALPDATAPALVIECGPERLDAKQAIFADLLARTGPETLLATASSAIPMSQIVPEPAAQARCLVAHPVNPPSVLRLIELVPAPGTRAEHLTRAAALFEGVGFRAVTLGAEIEGFVLNRLQGALLREAYRLVEDGILGPGEIDDVVRLGLGPRWALSGPFETADLNTPGGITAHAARMGPAYKRMGEARGERVDWSPALVERVAADRRARVPEADIPARVAWRAEAVARLVAARDRIAGGGDE